MNPLITIASSGKHCDTHFVLCPFAGGGKRTFTSWQNLGLTNESISVILYPGREARIDDPAVETIESLAEELVQALIKSDIRVENTVLIGHSMGAKVAYETTKQLNYLGLFPKGLVLSGCQAPHIQGRRLIEDYDDQTFIESLIEMGGCDPSLLENPQWWSIFLPTLRADFSATNNYLFPSPPNEQAKLLVPTLLISGNNDIEAYFAEVDEWKLWCSEVDDHLVVEGEHFYITEKAKTIFEYIRAFSMKLESPQVNNRQAGLQRELSRR
ncbi:alpha/beta fold hydrolase [Vibrio sp. AND4]